LIDFCANLDILFEIDFNNHIFPPTSAILKKSYLNSYSYICWTTKFEC